MGSMLAVAAVLFGVLLCFKVSLLFVGLFFRLVKPIIFVSLGFFIGASVPMEEEGQVQTFQQPVASATSEPSIIDSIAAVSENLSDRFDNLSDNYDFSASAKDLAGWVRLQLATQAAVKDSQRF